MRFFTKLVTQMKKPFAFTFCVGKGGYHSCPIDQLNTIANFPIDSDKKLEMWQIFRRFNNGMYEFVVRYEIPNDDIARMDALGKRHATSNNKVFLKILDRMLRTPLDNWVNLEHAIAAAMTPFKEIEEVIDNAKISQKEFAVLTSDIRDSGLLDGGEEEKEEARGQIRDYLGTNDAIDADEISPESLATVLHDPSAFLRSACSGNFQDMVIANVGDYIGSALHTMKDKGAFRMFTNTVTGATASVCNSTSSTSISDGTHYEVVDGNKMVSGASTQVQTKDGNSVQSLTTIATKIDLPARTLTEIVDTEPLINWLIALLKAWLLLSAAGLMAPESAGLACSLIEDYANYTAGLLTVGDPNEKNLQKRAADVEAKQNQCLTRMIGFMAYLNMNKNDLMRFFDTTGQLSSGECMLQGFMVYKDLVEYLDDLDKKNVEAGANPMARDPSTNHIIIDRKCAIVQRYMASMSPCITTSGFSKKLLRDGAFTQMMKLDSPWSVNPKKPYTLPIKRPVNPLTLSDVLKCKKCVKNMETYRTPCVDCKDKFDQFDAKASSFLCMHQKSAMACAAEKCDECIQKGRSVHPPCPYGQTTDNHLPFHIADGKILPPREGTRVFTYCGYHAAMGTLDDKELVQRIVNEKKFWYVKSLW